MRPLRLAKENLENVEPGVELISEDQQASDEIAIRPMELMDAEMQEDDEDIIECHVALEELSILSGTIRHLIATEQCTPGTLMMVNACLHNSMSPDSYGSTSLAMEASADIVEQHQIALEGIGDFFNNIFQNIVVSNKKHRDVQLDLFKSLREEATKYESRGEKAVREFQQKKGGFNQVTHTGYLGNVWEFFSNQDGQVHEIGRGVKADLVVSKYVLETYPKQVLASLDKLAQVINSAKVDTADGIKKLGQDIANLQHPSDLFKKEYLNGYPHLGVVGYKIKTGHTFGEVEVLGLRLPKLTQLARSRRVELITSLWHFLKQGFKSPVGGISFEYSTDEIGTVCQASIEYADLVRKYSNLDAVYKTSTDGLETAIKNLVVKASRLEDKELSGALGEVMGVISRLQFDFQKCFRNPGNAEARRAITGARYCNYLGLRMIYNAK